MRPQSLGCRPTAVGFSASWHAVLSTLQNGSMGHCIHKLIKEPGENRTFHPGPLLPAREKEDLLPRIERFDRAAPSGRLQNRSGGSLSWDSVPPHPRRGQEGVNRNCPNHPPHCSPPTSTPSFPKLYHTQVPLSGMLAPFLSAQELTEDPVFLSYRYRPNQGPLAASIRSG